MVGAAESIGMRARFVMVTDGYWKDYTGNHSLVEVWIPSLSKWVLMDPMGDWMFAVDAVPASALDIYDCARQEVLEKVELIGRQSCMSIEDKAVRRLFKHVYVSMTNALFDGYSVRMFGRKRVRFAHFANEYSAPFPVVEQRVALACGAGIFLFGGAITFSGLTHLVIKNVGRLLLWKRSSTG
jgi:hypothetical protein